MVWDRVRGWLSNTHDFGSLSQKIFAVAQGRHTFFALFFAGTGFYLACHKLLTDPYVNLIIAIQGYVLIHSGKEAVEEYTNRKIT